ncbi:carbohydrate-binding module family 21 protein [Phanerochaete sordida]|uniref:Carbohydrate-binding module family 21 protein n=1 Tax=Phanerochaete sordida TaxID=48140 RepID=A0A9P3LAC9_9APHY|nr:carbohydrate-binding module family 21 protein [Phanerochaete sordida]
MPAKVVVQPPSPPNASAAQPAASTSTSAVSSSGSGSDTYVEMAAPKPRRARGYQRAPIPSMVPPEQSTPTPALLAARDDLAAVPFPSFDVTPRASASMFAPRPRPGIAPLSTLNPKAEHLPPRSVSVNMASVGRKKSGEPLKSSLKSRRPVLRGDLSVITGPISTKSEPSTPTHIKSVHFDSQLEHVKLFLAEQKPLAVSRDGSPTDDTSGTESDFPAFIYGADEEKKGKLLMQVDGLRAESAEESSWSDAMLEKLELSEDGMTVNGHVRVRNLAFEKWVAVRFTFDLWQTTSEVTARYVDSICGGSHDRFHFTIRLNDMMSRIEEKTMFLAVRYSAAGRDIWDNNNGQNYKITFSREKVQRVQPKKLANEAAKVTGLADLKSKLEKVATDESRATVGSFLSSRASRTQSLSPAGPASGKADEDDEDVSFTLKSNRPLSSRYDFAASLKSPWRRSSANDATPVPAPAAGDRNRTITYPTTFPQFPRRTDSADKRAFVALTRGSPRIFDGDESEAQAEVRSHYANSDLEDTPVPAMARKPARNHQRGYFDLGVAPSASGVRRTPPGSPFGLPSLSPSGSGRSSPARPESVPALATASAFAMPVIIGAQRMWRVSSGGSEDSTPSSLSNDESSRSSSPDGSPYEGPLSLQPEEPFVRTPSPNDKGSYDAFLNRFCFYTGSDSLLDVPSELHRSHSASSVEEFLSTSPYLGTDYRMATPTRSSSFDDVITMSGSTTPTATSVAAGAGADTFPSPPQPAVAFVH